MAQPSADKVIFQAALFLTDPGQRAEYLDVACQEDSALRERVESLLKSATDDGGFLAKQAVESLVAPPVAREPDAAAATMSSAEDVTETIGKRVGNYKLLQQIGEGGFGVVYMAEQEQPVRRRVALKIIKLGMDTRQVIARFEAERQALALMDHPNIAKVLDAGATETGRPYFVMELIRGVPITQFCDENNLATEERLALFADVCSAIQHAHQKGIIHRDIKPTNVMITMHDDRAVPKVIDFGVAKATEHRLTEKTLFTEYAQMIGTPAYMSPEQAQMSGLDVDTRSDIYSLGVLLYELLVGRPPFDPKELRQCGYEEMCRRIREVEPAKPSTRLSTLTGAEVTTVAKHRDCDAARLSRLLRGELDWIVMKALEKDRRRRYETASSLAADVRRYLRDETVSAVAPSAWYQLQKFWKRNRAAVLTGGAFALLLVLGTVVSTWQAVQARRASRLAIAEQIRAVNAEESAQLEAARAEESRLAARKNEYYAEIRLAQVSLRNRNVDHALEILERHIPRPDELDLRGFEWRWLWEQCHPEKFVLKADGQGIYDVAFSPDRRWLAVAERKGFLRIWDVRRREVVDAQRLTQPGTHPTISFSPDGRRLAVKDAGAIALWGVDDDGQTEFEKELREESEVTCLSFASDGKVVAGYGDGRLLVWDTSLETNTPISAHEDSIASTAFASASARFATASPDGHVKVWDYASDTVPQEPVKSFNGVEGVSEQFVAISPDGRLVASAAFFGPTIVWNVDSGEPAHQIPSNGTETPHDMTFSGDGEILAVAGTTGALELIDTDTWQRVATYEHRGHQLNTIAFSPGEGVLVSAGDTGLVMAWDVHPPPGTGLLGGHAAYVNRAICSPNGRMIGVACTDGSVTVWDVLSEKVRLPIRAWRKDGNSLPPPPGLQYEFFAFSPDGRHLAVCAPPDEVDNEHSVLFYDIRQNRLLEKEKLNHASTIYSVAYSPDGKMLAVGCEGTVHLWDLAKRMPVNELPVQGSALCLAFSPDSMVLAVEDWGPIKLWENLWDAETREPFETLDDFMTPVGNHWALTFSPDGKILAAGAYDGKVLLWETATWMPREPLLGHVHSVLGLSFSNNGKRLASASLMGETKLWSLDDRREVANFPGMTVDFAQNGNVLAVGGLVSAPFDANGLPSSVRLYRAPTLEEIDRARAGDD